MKYVTLIFLCLIARFVQAQEYNILIKGGHVIDTKNGINEVMDIAISDGLISKIAKEIPKSHAKQVIDATDFYVSPGLIDIHTHVFMGTQPNKFADGLSSVFPDYFTFRSGITTVVDVGSAGWRNFPVFKKQVIDQSQTRVLAFLNISGLGMEGFPNEQDISNMNSQMSALVIQQYPEIVGVKIGHYTGKNWAPFERALEAGIIANVPIMIEAHLPHYPLEELLDRMRPGDIFSQAFKNTSGERISVVDDQGIVRPFVIKAKEKGILFDTGHGGFSFHFKTAIPAFDQGLLPDSFGTDFHRGSMNGGMKDILNLMSKYLAFGMSIEEVISRATWSSAVALKRNDLGNLGEGEVADIAIFGIRQGNFGFLDASGTKLEGSRKLECELTIRAGKVVFDLNGMASNSTIINGNNR